MRVYLPTRLIAFAGSALLAISSAAPALAAPPDAHVAGPAASAGIVMLAPGHAAPQAAPGAHPRGVGGEVGLTFTHAINGFQFEGSAAAVRSHSSEPERGCPSPRTARSR